ncbi:hypothetical protein CVD28_02640 [Bacillus sp. M6-12]|uniref:hypothetical protein n=1 Tax=Bacillus sp. M6-12 TaxID=2054166 RepID=UPI000C77E2AB|nr:hypothetical protein [Bacillus sp. M6-12]PLS19330.1 hypothetical protein CVD28_02640 [Bacillus sp. M6-12]
MKHSINTIQADIIFKALYYTARNEKVEISPELTHIYEVLAEQNPNETHVEDTVGVMESLSEFIKNSSEFSEYFTTEDDNEDND